MSRRTNSDRVPSRGLLSGKDIRWASPTGITYKMQLICRSRDISRRWAISCRLREMNVRWLDLGLLDDGSQQLVRRSGAVPDRVAAAHNQSQDQVTTSVSWELLGGNNHGKIASVY